MTVETASLIYRIDSSQVVTADAALDKMTAAAARAETAERSLAAAVSSAAAAFRAQGNAVGATQQSASSIASSAAQASQNLKNLTAVQRQAEQQSRSTARAAQEAAAQEAQNARRYREVAQAAIERQAAMNASIRAAVSAAQSERTITAEIQAQARAYTAARSAEQAHRNEQRAAAAAARQAAQALAQQKAGLAGLLESIDPVTRALNRLDQQQRQLREARSAGLLDADTFADYNNKIEESRAGLTRFSTGLNAAGQTARQAANNMRMLPAQITDITVGLATGQAPMMVFLQQGGQLKDMFGGIGPAARAVGSYLLGLVNPFTVAAAAAGAMAVAWYQGSREMVEFDQRLIMTGNALGVTSGQIVVMAERLGQLENITQSAATRALTDVAKTGKITSDMLESVAEVALRSNQLLGRGIGAVVEEFERLGDKPTEAVAKLNKEYNFLTLATYEQIRALERQGKAQDAARLAQETYANATNARLKDVQLQVGYLERAWRGVTAVAKGAWDAMMNIGRPETAESSLTRVNAELKQAREQLQAAEAGAIGVGGGRDYSGEIRKTAAVQIARLEAQQAFLQAQVQTSANIAKAQQLAAEENQRAIDAREGIAGLLDQVAPKAKQAEKALEDYRRKVEDIRRVDPANPLVQPAAVKEAEEQIKEYYKEAKTAIDRASESAKKWVAEQNVAAAAARELAAAYQIGGAAVSALARQEEVAKQAVRFKAQDYDAVKVAVEEYGKAMDRLDVAKQIDAQRKTSDAAESYLTVLRAQNKGVDEGRKALRIYNEEQARTALLAGKTREEIEDLLPAWQEMWSRSAAAQEQREALEEINKLIGQTRTRQESFNAQIQELERLRGYAKTEEEVRAVERAIKDLNDANSVWFELTSDAIERIDESFASMWRSTIDGSEDAFSAMKGGFNQMLAEMAHAAITRPITISLSNALLGTNRSGGIGDVWGSMPSGSGASNALGNGIGWLGEKFGSTALQSFSQGMTGAAATFGQSFALNALPATASWAGTAAGLSSAVAPSLSGLTIGSGVSASLGSGLAGSVGAGTSGLAAGGSAAAGLGSAFATALPYVGLGLAAVNLVSGFLDSGPPKTRHGQRTTVEMLNDVFSITAIDDRQAAGSEQAALAAAQSTVKAANDLFAQLGVNAAIESLYAIMESSILGDRQGVASGGTLRIGEQVRQIGIPQASDMTLAGFGGWSSADMWPRLQTDLQLTLLEALQLVGDQLPRVMADRIRDVDFRNIGAEAAQEMAEWFSSVVSEVTAFGSIVETLPFAQLKNLSFDAKASLLEFGGGLEALTGNLNSFFQNFYSEVERQEIALGQLQDAFSGLGLTLPETREGFREIVEAQDLNTESGRELWSALMQLQGAFAQAVPATEDLTGGLTEAELAAQKAAEAAAQAAEAYKLYVQRVREIWDAVTQAADNALARLTDSIAAEKTQLQKESEAVAKALQGSIDVATASVRSLNSLIGRLQSTLSSLSQGQPDQARTFQWAQARVERALSVATLTGVMPGGDDFEAALQVVAKPSESLYSSFEEYYLDYLKTALTVQDLNDLAGASLSTEEQSLQSLTEQLETSQAWYADEISRLDQILEQEQQALEVAKGSYQALLSVSDALAAARTATQNVGNAVAPPGTPVNGPLTREQAYMVNNPDVAAAYLEGQFGDMTLEQAVAFHYAKYGKWEGRSFQSGTNFVPRTGLAMLHAGEAVVPAYDNQAMLNAIQSNSANASGWTAIIRAIQTSGQEQSRLLYDIAGYTAAIDRTNSAMADGRAVQRSAVQGNLGVAIIEDLTTP